jgi:dTDP-4-dehydrorhamnose 3,5-epimerase
MPLQRVKTRLPGLVLLAPAVHHDERGFFLETYEAGAYAALGVDVAFIQDNHSRSRRGTLRGLHFQTEPGQAKLMRAATGRILDVVVDIRRSSPTFGEHESFELDDEAHHQLFVPIGFAHGFYILSERADVVYKVSSTYDPATEAGIAWDDPALGIDWRTDAPIVSERDRSNPTLEEIADRLPAW